MKSLVSSLLAGGVLLAGTAATIGQELSYSSHLPPSVAVNSHGIIPLFEAVEAESGGGLSVKFFWAGQLFDAAGNFVAVRDGVVDAAFTQAANNQAEMRTNTIFTDLYQYGGDPYVTAAAYNETILLDCEECQDEYASNGAIFLGAHAATPAKLICSDVIGSMDDIRGLKIIGGPALARWAQSLGGTQFDVPPPRQMETIQRGQADCTFASPEWLRAFSLADIAKSIVDVPIGSQFATSIFTFNKARWEGLSPELRDSFLRQLPVAIAGIIDRYVEIEDDAVADAVENGVVVTDLDGEYASAFQSYMTGYRANVEGDAATRGIQNASPIIDTFLANMEKWEALIAEHGTEDYADLLWQEIYSQLPN